MRALSVRGMTVDAEGARVLDDAIWVEHTPTGFSLTVSAADVAALVKVGSQEDTDALVLGASTLGSAMLTKGWLRRLASLLPGERRNVVSVRMSFDHTGRRIGPAVAFRASLVSIEAFSHASFESAIDRLPGAVRSCARASVDLASRLWIHRMRDVRAPWRWKAAFDASGVLRADSAPGALGETVVHELIVEANSACAELVAQAGMPLIHRNHAPRLGERSGRYEVACRGHAGLGKARYAQFFSPIRRYSDLVNQRMLIAACQGEKAPHDAGDIARACTVANLVDARPDTERQEHSPSFAFRSLDAPRLQSLMRRNGLSDHRLWTEFVRRLEFGMMTPLDMGWMLLGRDSPVDDALRTKLLTRLAVTPHMLAQIWDAMAAAGKVPPLDTETAHDGNLWRTTVAAGRFTEQGEGRDPIRAKDEALLALCRTLLGLEEPATADPDMKIHLSEHDAEREMALLCRAAGWSEPRYTLSAEPASNGNLYLCEARIKTPRFEYVSPRMHGTTESLARFEAADMALAVLSPYAHAHMKEEVEARGVDMSVFHADKPPTAKDLEIFCKRNDAALRFDWIEERPGVGRYTCLVNLEAESHVVRAKGTGPQRTDAMDAAVCNLAALIRDS